MKICYFDGVDIHQPRSWHFMDWSDSCHGGRQTDHRGCGNIRHLTLSLDCKVFCWQRFYGKVSNQWIPLSIKWILFLQYKTSLTRLTGCYFTAIGFQKLDIGERVLPDKKKVCYWPPEKFIVHRVCMGQILHSKTTGKPQDGTGVFAFSFVLE